jgi:hypothetical protein
MTSFKPRTLLWLCTAALLPAIAACDGGSPATTDKPVSEIASPAPAVPADLFLAQAPAEARGVGAVKADPQASGEVVVYGRIGGRVEPFVSGMAIFLLADTEMEACNEKGNDHCATPWDYCCEPRESLLAKTATIQVVGNDGKPLRVDLSGRHGLDPLREIVVRGEIAQREGDALVINATGIYVKPKG